MVEFLSGGMVVLDFDEMLKIQRFVDRTQVLYEKYQNLKAEMEVLTKCHEYSNMCRDAFEEENRKLKEQLKADQYVQIRRISNEAILMGKSL